MNVRPTVERVLPRLPWTRDPAADTATTFALGPGGGAVTSHARCIARIGLEAVVASAFGRGPADPRWRRPQALAKALIAWIETGGDRQHATDRFDEEAVQDDPSAANRLAAWLTAPPPAGWPDWVPTAAFALALGGDPAAGLETAPPPPLDDAVADPWLAAALAARIRGPLFLRGATPDVACMIDWWPGRGPWELWRPVPEAVRAPAIAGAPALEARGGAR